MRILKDIRFEWTIIFKGFISPVVIVHSLSEKCLIEYISPIDATTETMQKKGNQPNSEKIEIEI